MNVKNYIFLFLFLLAVTGCNNNPKEVTQNLERSTPEAEGVSSQGIIDFLDEIQSDSIEVHSFMFLRHGKVIAEGWWEPYGPEYKHIMFSASKSITSIGIGIAIDEGLLQVSDRVVSFFPEYMTDSISENMKLLTVKDLLTMSVGQEIDPAYRFQFGKQDWISGFLHTTPVHEPGTVMMYNNFATFILSAIVQKVTGQMLFNYLEPRLFVPLGINNIDWDYNYMGINLGMIGSRLHTDDLAKLGQLLLQKGRWENKQIVSEEYVEQAGMAQITTNNEGKAEDELTDGEKGYGYQFWSGSHNSYRMDGMGGQLAIVMPDHDAVVIFTSNVPSSQIEMDLVWNNLVPAMKDEPLAANPDLEKELTQKLASLKWMPDVETTIPPELINLISGKTFTMSDNQMNITGLTFAFNNDTCSIKIEQGDRDAELIAGIGNWQHNTSKGASLSSLAASGFDYRKSSNQINRDYRNMKHMASTIGMKDEKTMILTTRFIEESLGAETWEFEFSQSGRSTELKLNPGSGGRRGFGPPQQPVIISGKINN